MNEKATVSKELNDKHRKILEGLLKLPENKECADCKSKGPRWASVNLGVFLCMQCSGIHRSLGVHISKVRSAALDTWLPEQVAFIQTMGNSKANSYWEAELPPNYDRVGIENFIRAKYEEKRWVPRDTRFITPPKPQEGTGHAKKRSTDFNGDENSDNHKIPEKDNTPQSTIKDNFVVPKIPSPVSYSSNVETDRTQVASAVVNVLTTAQPKLDSASNLLDMLSLDDPSEVAEGLSSADDNSWANFQSAELINSMDSKSTTESAENKNKIKSEAEDLFKDSTSVMQPSTQTKIQTDVKTEATIGVEDLFNDSKSLLQPPSQTNTQTNVKNETESIVEELFKDSTSSLQPSAQKKTQLDVKNDIMSLFDKSNMVSPFALHQQQLAIIAHQQAYLAAAAKPNNSPSTLSVGQTHQRSMSDSNALKGNFAAQSWGNLAYQLPRNVPSGSQYPNNFGQMGNALHSSSGNLGHAPASSLGALDGENTTHAASSSSTGTDRSLNDYDFSSLTQGMFAKQ
ncbi:ADP-ribosylation factor GTPase-activating protein AGD5-like [Curcuma longa]|uniref:ADP-ribosylation factor GTPase-activating protein AGD5-like n=1 Tax=Curcuma longa TaxID=136217 RepID=UPI003D9DD3C3